MNAAGIELDLILPDALVGAFGDRDRLTLWRSPDRAGGHRAWDNADRYLLDELAVTTSDGRTASHAVSGATVVLGDHYGALTVALAAQQPTSVIDRASRRDTTVANLERNAVDPSSVQLVTPLDPLPERIALVVIRPPRSLDLLEYELRRISPLLSEDSVVIGADMTKHVHTSTLQTFERLIGPTTTSLARRRARLITARVCADRDVNASEIAGVAHLDRWDVDVVQYPGVFGSGPLALGRVDRGSALLLDSLEPPERGATVLDLGSGNGLLAAVIAKGREDLRLVAVDDSALATAATRDTLEANGIDATVLHMDVARPGPQWPSDASVDVVVCNPPFHDGRATGDDIAWAMFSAARRALRPGGDLWVVGNRHLGYHAKVKGHFGRVDQVGGDDRFVVLRARS